MREIPTRFPTNTSMRRRLRTNFTNITNWTKRYFFAFKNGTGWCKSGSVCCYDRGCCCCCCCGCCLLSLEPKSPQLTVVVLLTGFFSWSGEFAPTQLPFACDVGFTSFILSPLASFKLGFDDERERDILALGLEKGDLLLFSLNGGE